MPKKGKVKRKAKKAASRKPVKKAVRKKALKKKSPPRKKPIKKKAAKKKTLRKKAAKKPAQKTAKRAKPVEKQRTLPKPSMVEPGPPPRPIPPVEEPSPNEEAIGTITHYYSHLSVAVAQLNKGTLRVGDAIHIKGHTTDFTQAVESMEYEHQHIAQASAGQSVGIKVKEHVREHDIVYRVK